MVLLPAISHRRTKMQICPEVSGPEARPGLSLEPPCCALQSQSIPNHSAQGCPGGTSHSDVRRREKASSPAGGTEGHYPQVVTQQEAGIPPNTHLQHSQH